MIPQIGGSSAEPEFSPMYRVSLTEIVTGVLLSLCWLDRAVAPYSGPTTMVVARGLARRAG